MTDWWDNEPREVAHTVHEEEKPSWTGLYDANGQKLSKPPQRVGFDLRPKDKRHER